MSLKTFSRQLQLPVSAEEAFAWHERPGAFERLSPPWDDVEVVEKKGTIRDGDSLTIKMKIGPVSQTWVAVHEGYQPGRQFVDVLKEGPFKSWRHTHKFIPDGAGCILDDTIEYELPMGALGNVGAGYAEGTLERLFAYRHRLTERDLAFHAKYSKEKLKIAITGANGLVGQALSSFLTTGGHEVVRIVRRPKGNEVGWDVDKGTLDAAKLEGVDAVVHLAGEPIGEGRWSAEKKAKIIDSRVKGTKLVAETIAKLQKKPRVLVSASAVGYYGDRGDELLEESAPPGKLFISDVCAQWEASAQAARAAGIRVVHPRIGVVLSPKGGAMVPLTRAAKAGALGPVGSGAQQFSWLSLDDAVEILTRLVVDPSFSGPVNMVSDAPMSQKDFAKVLGHVLHRPAFAPLPKFAARLMFGEAADELLLASQKVKPARLLAAGHQFRDPELEPALRNMLGLAAKG